MQGEKGSVRLSHTLSVRMRLAVMVWYLMVNTAKNNSGKDMTSGDSLRGRVLAGLMWQVTSRGGERMVRFGANIVLAHLLSPDDFGLMGLVASALAAVEAISFLATDQVILHHDEGRERKFLDTVFVVAVVRSAVLALCILAVAPLLAGFYGQPQARGMFMMIALQPLIGGLMNPGAMTLVKDMRFAVWTCYRFSCTILGVGATIGLALAWRSAWALLLGQMITAVVVTVGSYVVAPHRPRWGFDREYWRAIRAYGLRAAGTPLFIALVLQAPALLLGKWAGPAVLGAFLLTQTLANIVREMVVQGIGLVFVPAYSVLQHDSERLKSAWQRAFWVVTLFCLPAAAVLGWMGDDLPRFVFGESYGGHPGTFPFLAASGALGAMIAVTGPLFWGVGKPSYDRTAQMVRAGLVFTVGAGMCWKWGGVGLAGGLVVADGCVLWCALVLVRRIIAVEWSEIRSAVWPGVLAAGLLFIILEMVDQWLAPLGGMRLLVGVMSGSVAIPFLLRHLNHREPSSFSLGSLKLRGVPIT